jgi:hypothetical protein
MSARSTIEILRRSGGMPPLGQAEWKRVSARFEWALTLIDQWYQAMCHRDEVCTEAVTRLSEEEFERFAEAEEAKVEAIRAQIDAAIERDEWPRELYFGGI